MAIFLNDISQSRMAEFRQRGPLSALHKSKIARALKGKIRGIKKGVKRESKLLGRALRQESKIAKAQIGAGAAKGATIGISKAFGSSLKKGFRLARKGVPKGKTVKQVNEAFNRQTDRRVKRGAWLGATAGGIRGGLGYARGLAGRLRRGRIG